MSSINKSRTHKGNRQVIEPDIIAEVWKEVLKVTKDLGEDEYFSITQLRNYLSSHHPKDLSPLTVQQIKYLHSQGIVIPEKYGSGTKRIARRYTPRLTRRVLLVQMLRTRHRMSIQEVKGRLNDLETAESQGVPPPPTSVELAFTLLRSRTLGTLITCLGRGRLEVAPRECLIAVRVLEEKQHLLPPRKLLSWDEAYRSLQGSPWHLAAVDPFYKLYMHPNVEHLVHTRAEVAQMLPNHDWYMLSFSDLEPKLAYEVLIGLPHQDSDKDVQAITDTISKQINLNLPFQLNDFPGLATLFKAAFGKPANVKEGATLDALAEIIAQASNRWDYCAILVPARADNEKEMIIQGSGGEFPLELKGRPVRIGDVLLPGWRQRYRFGIVVEPAVDDDPRLFLGDIPKAAVTVPAVSEANQIVGLVYVGRTQLLSTKSIVFSPELIAGIKALGYICGDIIARDRVEIDTVQGMTRLFIKPTATEEYLRFSNLDQLVAKVAAVIRIGVSPRMASHSWIYVVTLNVQMLSRADPRLDVLAKWLCQQAAATTRDLLINRLYGNRKPPLKVGECELDLGQFVFAVLDTVDLPEEDFKKRLIGLREELYEMQIPWLSTEFYPWGVALPYEQLQPDYSQAKADSLETYLRTITEGALAAGPHISQGHAALSEGDIDKAITHFENAQQYAPDNWYVYKHLAEAWMLKGKFDEAIEQCNTALTKNPRYTSARCLLADCLIYQGRHSEALIQYEQTLRWNPRADFLIRYAIALAGMTTEKYKEALTKLREERRLISKRGYAEPYEDAIDKLEDARRRSRVPNLSSDQEREQEANYYYHRGYIFLRAGKFERALQEFAIGRKYSPDDLRLSQAYAHANALMRMPVNIKTLESKKKIIRD